MQIFEIKLFILQHFLCGIMFTTMITCIQGEHRSTENKSYQELGYRLSKDVVPLHYDISLDFFSERLDVVSGKCKIDVDIFKSTSNIRLHSPDKIEESSIKLAMNGTTYKPINKTHSEEENVLDLYFEDQLSPGRYSLTIHYSKDVGDDKKEGDFFKIIFKPATRNRWLATNINSVEARKWFPCWDEPEFKTTFNFTFYHHRRFKIWPALPNATSIGHVHKKEWCLTKFFIAVTISTYQLMFVVTEIPLFSHTEYTSYSASCELHKVNEDNTILSRAPVENSIKFSDVVIEKILDSEWYCKILLTDFNINQLALPAVPEDVIAKWRLILCKYIDNKIIIRFC
ncbi:aminopeptidase Q-like [Ooceraea biroi]|uniref:aminopeptidase Q-like n=1 Tax=Ooceraea biroi TaxID=2015173 RepID=UPI000F096AA0|nr:aminopeptidase Q-like [Ooceraea biroi]